MREFIRSKFFKVALLVLALLLGIMIYAISRVGVGTFTSQMIGAIASPFQQLSSYISGTATDFFEKFVNADTYKSENEELRQQIADLRNQLVNYDEMQRENEQLKELTGLKEEYPDIQMVAATVVGRDPSERFGSFTIDKGSLAGIHYRDAIITSQGLVGVVTEVGEVYSKVTTILSPDLKVSAIEKRTGEIGTVSGAVELSESNQCRLSFLAENSQIKKGDIIVTSGAGGLYPKDIVIGIADNIQTEVNGITSYTVVTPAFQIDSVKQVFVVTSFNGKVQGGE